MCPCLNDEAPGREVVKADDTGLATHGEVPVRVGDGDGVELVSFAAVGARFEDCLGVRLTEIPIGDLLLLAHTNEFVIIERGNREGIEATHALVLGRDALLSPKVPTEDRLVTRAGQQVLVIREELDLCYAASVLLQMRDQFT